MATARKAGSAPRKTPAGNMTGVSARMVPLAVPVPSENSMAARKVMTVNTLPWAPTLSPNQSSPSMMPPACMIWPKTLTKIQEAHSTPTLLLLNPRRTVAQYSLGVLERKRPMQMAAKPMLQKFFGVAGPCRDNHKRPQISRSRGMAAPHFPPTS